MLSMAFDSLASSPPMHMRVQGGEGLRANRALTITYYPAFLLNTALAYEPIATSTNQCYYMHMCKYQTDFVANMLISL